MKAILTDAIKREHLFPALYEFKGKDDVRSIWLVRYSSEGHGEYHCFRLTESKDSTFNLQQVYWKITNKSDFNSKFTRVQSGKCLQFIQD